MFLSRYVLRKSSLVYSSVICCNFRNHHVSLCQRSQLLYPRNRISAFPIVQSSILNQFMSTAPPTEEKPLTSVQKLKTAVKDYGSTVIVFHVSISLVSLGCCYLAIYSGLDLMGYMKSAGSNFDGVTAVASASTFVVAYAVHKVLAPIRISITLGAVPFIVRYLRKKGFLKPPKPK